MIRPDEKVILLTSGGDWYDASADMIIYSGDIREAYKKYNELGAYTGTHKHFLEWIKENGARDGDEQLDYMSEDGP